MLTWTDEMGLLSHEPKYETAARAALVAACEHWAALPAGGEPPGFAGGLFVLPKNAAAVEVIAVIEKHLTTIDPKTENLIRQRIIATAVRGAEYYVAGGKNPASWQALASLSAKRPARAERPR